MANLNSNEDALKQYYNSLIELNQNSKPFISMLTILAEENMNIADGIVNLIIQRIFNVTPDIKLCCLYLIDSICKNIGKDYIELFSKNLVIVFHHIFDKGDHAIRDNLYKTRKTWKGLFRDDILDKLDIEINKLDSKWPIDKKTNLKQKESNELINNNLISNKLNQLNELPNLQQPQLSNQQIPRASILEYVNNKKRQLIGKRSPSPDHKRSPNWNNNQPNSNNFNLNNNHMNFNKMPTSSNTLTSTINDFNLSKLTNLNNISVANSNIQPTSSVIQAPIQSSFQQLLPSQILQPQNLSNFFNHQIINDNNIPGLNDTRNDKLLNIFNSTQSNLNNINLPSSLNALNQISNLKNTDIDYRFNQPPPNFLNNQILNQSTTQTNLALNPQSPEELKLQVDGKIRKLYYLDDHSAIVLMNCIPDLSFDKLKYIKPHELDPRSICFEGPPVNVIIDEKNFISLSFDNQWKIFYHNNFEQKIKFGGPVKEIYLNNQVIQAKFGGPPVLCKLIGDFNDHTLRLGLPAPKVKLSDHTCIELWLELLQKYAPQQLINNLNNNNYNLNIKPPLYQPLIQPPAIVTQPLVLPMIANPEQAPIIPEPLNSQPIIPQAPNLINPVNSFFVPQSTSIPLINDQAPIQNGSKVLKEQLNNNNLTSSINDKKESQQQHQQQTKSKKNKKDKNLKEKDKTTEEPELTLDSASLKIRRESLINSLYSGSQCTNCSLRFDNTTDKGKSKYSAHLDWHFRQNRKTRDSNFRTSTRNRDWYLPSDLWLKYKEINMEEENENTKQPSIFELNNPVNNDDQKDQIDIPLIKANIDDKLNICSICYERFNQRWCDDEEEWRLENAVLNEDKYYHPSCLNDMLNKSLNEDEITVKDDETMKSEETILRISDSMLENYEPSIIKEEDVDDEEMKLKENDILNEENNNENNLDDNELDKLNIENEKNSINDKIEFIEDTDSQIDTNNLVKKTVLNISDEQMEDDPIKLDNKELDENKIDADLKVEIIGLNIADKENESTEITDDNNEIVKKIELKPNAKKELKPILLKLKDSNLELVNQRNKEFNSPTSDNSKSPLSQNDTNNDYNYLEDPNVNIRDREESALCTIM